MAVARLFVLLTISCLIASTRGAVPPPASDDATGNEAIKELKDALKLLVSDVHSIALDLKEGGSKNARTHEGSAQNSSKNLSEQKRGEIEDLGYHCSKYGCYKIYEVAVSWKKANDTCGEDGGQLVIINSIQEANLLKVLIRGTAIQESPFIGIIYVRNYDWVTVFGIPLAETGYSRWRQSIHNELGKCGVLDSQAYLDYLSCDSERPFICEIPLA